MNAIKGNLLAGTIMTPSERAQGRYLRAPEGHDTTAATPPQNQNNQQGNDGESKPGDENNNGLDPALAGFWEEPKGEEKPSAESTPKPDANQSDDGANFGKTLVERLNGLKFDDVFTAEVADQLAKDDLTGANERMAAMGRETIRQATILNAQIMKSAFENFQSQVESMIESKLGNRDNDQTLLEAFPSAKDPATRPLIQSVFNQALKHTGGNREKAIPLARDMLKLVGKNAASDLGLETPPGDRESQMMTDGATALVDELLAR